MAMPHMPRHKREIKEIKRNRGELVGAVFDERWQCNCAQNEAASVTIMHMRRQSWAEWLCVFSVIGYRCNRIPWCVWTVDW